MTDAEQFRDRITASSLSIYDPIERGDPELWMPSEILQELLNQALLGFSAAGLPLRTRSKVMKTRVCAALGYPAPKSFAKTHPRFPGQDLDVYSQKRRNLQVWNEDLTPTRRYVLIGLDEHDVVHAVRVVSGDTLAKLDLTGTLTRKFQARIEFGPSRAELLSPSDTDLFPRAASVREGRTAFLESPSSAPDASTLLPITEIFARIEGLMGTTVRYLGATQERNRGSEVHRAICAALGYSRYRDDGQFPDIRHQLLEVKLQTAATIDLGLVLPSSEDSLDLPRIGGRPVRHCDVRYAVVGGEVHGDSVLVTHLFVTTGESFLQHFPQCEGKRLNKKLQIPLPVDFFG